MDTLKGTTFLFTLLIFGCLFPKHSADGVTEPTNFKHSSQPTPLWEDYNFTPTKDVTEKEAQLFLIKLFQKYGEEGLMTFEGFEHLLQSLGIGKIRIDDHDIQDHYTDQGFKEFHTSHNHTNNIDDVEHHGDTSVHNEDSDDHGSPDNKKHDDHESTGFHHEENEDHGDHIDTGFDHVDSDDHGDHGNTNVLHEDNGETDGSHGIKQSDHDNTNGHYEDNDKSDDYDHGSHGSKRQGGHGHVHDRGHQHETQGVDSSLHGHHDDTNADRSQTSDMNDLELLHTEEMKKQNKTGSYDLPTRSSSNTYHSEEPTESGRRREHKGRLHKNRQRNRHRNADSESFTDDPDWSDNPGNGRNFKDEGKSSHLRRRKRAVSDTLHDHDKGTFRKVSFM